MSDPYGTSGATDNGTALYTGKKHVSRPDPKRYRRYDWWYKNSSDLFTKLKWGKEISEVGRRAYMDTLERENRAVIKALRNPVHRVVEFYATTMLTGTAKQAFPLRELPSEAPEEPAEGAPGEATDGVPQPSAPATSPPAPVSPPESEEEKTLADHLRDAIHTLWGWSNLDAQKQVLKRLVAKHGLCFIKVASPADLDIVHFQLIKAEHCSDYTRDERGNINYIRLDIPIELPIEEAAEEAEKNPGDPNRNKKTHTEIWRKGKNGKSGYYRVWTRERDVTETSVVAESDLGPPEKDLVLSERAGKNSLLFDFVPFVDVFAMDTGEKWPAPVYDHALAPIEEANKMVTRYHDLLFIYNKPHRAIVGIGNDPSGRPYPAPEIPGVDRQKEPVRDQDTVPFGGEIAKLLNAAKPDETLGGDIWYGAPGTSKIDDITPNIEFEAQRRAVLDITDEIKRELPELLYYETRANAEISARALRLVIASALDRTLEMRSNIENAIIKADKMGLTMAQVKGLSGFEEEKIGSYDPDKGFKHSFEETDTVAVSDIENEELRGRRIANAIALMQMGLSRGQAFQEVGMTHLKFAENSPEGDGLPPNELEPGTGGNPGGGTNLEGAARRVAQFLRGTDSSGSGAGGTSGFGVR